MNEEANKNGLSKAKQAAIERLKQKRSTTFNADDLVNGILNSDTTSLSRAITLIESNNLDQQALGQDILNRCIPHSGKSIRVGITGVPGVGKSTFIESFGELLTSKGNKVAVLAIDPSSQKSGGSILGDKTRMETLSANPNAFIRPSASADSLGGVARKTRESIILCEAAGYNIILVETVGVGQSETEVHSMVDFFLLLMLAGAGDELQGIKRGIMEMADLITITKADSGNEQNAKNAVREYKNAIHLFPPTASGWIPTVLTCSSLQKQGLEHVLEKIKEHDRHFITKGLKENKRKEQSRYWMKTTIQHSLLEQFYKHKTIKAVYAEKEKAVMNNVKSPFTAAQELLALVMSK